MWNLLSTAAVLLSVWVAPSDAQTSPSFFSRSSVAVAAKFNMQVSVTDLGLKGEPPPVGKRGTSERRSKTGIFSPLLTVTSHRARCAPQLRPTRSPTMRW
jgi:hypothetical protein